LVNVGFASHRLARFHVTRFNLAPATDTPQKLIDLILPNVLVKGGDSKAEEIVGYDIVNGNGGRVEIVPYLDGNSSSEILKRLG